VLKALEDLDGAGQSALAVDIIELLGRLNASDDDTLVVPSEYLEVLITRR
jgi:hypothetical protein